MAIQNYTVHFNKAYTTDYPGGIVMPDIFRGPIATHKFDAANAAEVVEKVTELAEADGRSLTAYVYLTDRTARKPRGFDAATRNLFFNLTPEPKGL